MKQNTHTSKSLNISDLKLIGGGKTLNISVLRRSSIFIFTMIIVSFVCFSCSEETSVSQYPEMQAYYAESCNLGVTSADSIVRFVHKFGGYVKANPASTNDQYYQPTYDNMVHAGSLFGLTITSVTTGIKLETDWEDENVVNF